MNVLTHVGTHDFGNISVSSLDSGDVMVTGNFTDGSMATGILIIVIGESSIINYHQAMRDDNSIRNNIISGLPGRLIAIHTFDLIMWF